VDRDFSRSRAILIGNGVYRPDSGISDIPAAPACVSAMSGLLMGELCGWTDDRVTPLVDIETPQELARKIHRAVNDVQDILLLYYVGHGIRTVKGKLALTVGDSDADPALVHITGILYEDIAEILRCGATTKLVILDCCKAELGSNANYVFQSVDIAEEYPVEGLYFIGASKRHEGARFAHDGTLTYFTENFIEVVKRGIPGPVPQLRLDQIFPELRRRLVFANLPEPVESGSRGAHQYAFARNAAYQLSENQTAGQQIRHQPAARFLEEAERAAQSITSQNGRARALIAVAQALADSDPRQADRLFSDAELAAAQSHSLAAIAQAVAGSDPRRAGRLFSDAELAAQSITGKKDQARALIGIAQAVAGSDPQAAERIAQSITGQDDEARALVRIAQEVAGSDPQAAERLFSHAERIALSITDGSAKAQVLVYIAKAVAGSDPRATQRLLCHAELAAKSITDKGKAWALAEVAEMVADSDPRAAGRLFSDAERAARRWVLVYIAKAVAGSDPHPAGRLFSAERAARSNWGRKKWALGAVARAMADSDPQRAERIARSIIGKEEKARTLVHIAWVVADSDPQAAGRLYGDAERAAQSITGLARKKIDKASTLAWMAPIMAVDDPDRAERIARSITVDHEYARALFAVAEEVAGNDPERANRLFSDAEHAAQSMDSGEKRAEALANMARAVVGSDPEWANRLFSDAERAAQSIDQGFAKVGVTVSD
jgi:hypothetical protein